MRRSPIPHPAVFECSCGACRNSADGLPPVGWTLRAGECWCDDCTRAGVPVRHVLHGGSRARRRRAA